MSPARYTRVRANEIEGFQHARDNYWYRPVVLGTNLFTYVAYVPPGGVMPPHGHEEDPYELSFFMVAGELEVSLDGDTFHVDPGDAIHVQPTVSLGVHNRGRATAIFVLTFNPPPPIGSIETLRARYQARGDGVKPPAEMNALAQEGL